ncbi:MAG: hypothetical protein ABSG42_07185, partial [Nitrospirota bacterium]
MKRLHLLILTIGLCLMAPIAAAAQYEAAANSAPPVGQALIREGDYAVELAKALNVGNVTSEADAEDALAAVGISPKSGWISDFPVTPDILAGVEASADMAVDAGSLPMNKVEVDKAFLTLNTRLALDVTPGAAANDNEQAEAPPAPSAANNYYYDEGPPVITYYTPPPDYAYLYAWDPFPFWCGGFWFPGYFVLADFNFGFRGHHGFFGRDEFGFYRNGGRGWEHGAISNHVIDPVSGRSVTVDPVSKRPLTRTAYTPVGAKSFEPVSRTAGGASFNRASASSLLSRGGSRTERGGT